MNTVETIEQGKVRYAQRSGDRTDRILQWLGYKLKQARWWVIFRQLARLTHQYITEGPFEVQEGEEVFCSYHYQPVYKPLPLGYKYYIKSDGINVVYSCAWCESRDREE